MNDKELMQQALEIEMLAKRFNEGWHEGIKIDALDIELLLDVAAALRERLAQPEQEPVAWVVPSWLNSDTRLWESQSFSSRPIKGWLPLYTATLQWQGLTDDEIAEIAATPAAIPGRYVHSFARAIEAKLKEKNT